MRRETALPTTRSSVHRALPLVFAIALASAACSKESSASGGSGGRSKEVLPARHLTLDARQHLAEALRVAVDTSEDHSGPTLWIGARDPSDLEEKVFAAEIRNAFIEAHWKGAGTDTWPGQKPFDGIVYNQYQGPVDPQLKDRFSQWVEIVRRVVPLFGQACKIVHNESLSDSIAGSIIIGRPKPEQNPSCDEGDSI
jgi:hypothetical protein